ncbi:MAG TPA: maleylpyruvate isomerase N-terminal domain-containing protein [Candidatus Binatia bacterium]|nr:maleylpyruvate isomerase N-terminal domain-containing protein [Candidatus Binatia bacterium]
MYLDGLSFLEDERAAWRPFEALNELSDEALSRPVEAAHGWSGRDLMAHLVAWQEIALAMARELAVGETSPTLDRVEAEWDAGGDAMNERLLREWSALPLTEVRERFRTIPGELRGTLTVVPEARWVKHHRHLSALLEETLDHYAEHEADLAAILAAAR